MRRKQFLEHWRRPENWTWGFYCFRVIRNIVIPLTVASFGIFISGCFTEMVCEDWRADRQVDAITDAWITENEEVMLVVIYPRDRRYLVRGSLGNSDDNNKVIGEIIRGFPDLKGNECLQSAFNELKKTSNKYVVTRRSPFGATVSVDDVTYYVYAPQYGPVDWRSCKSYGNVSLFTLAVIGDIITGPFQLIATGVWLATGSPIPI